MPMTNFPNGISVRTASATNTAAGDNDLTCLDLFVDGTVNVTGASSIGGAITSATGSLYGGKVSLAFAGSAAPALYVAALTSALYDSGATIRAPFKCLAEIVYVQEATVGITVSVR